MFTIRIFLGAIVFLQVLPIVQCLRCINNCPWITFPLNVSVPFDACQHDERADGACSLSVEIDFKDQVTHGQLYMMKDSTTAYLTSRTHFSLETDSVKSLLIYLCGMSDYCGYGFLNELATNKLVEFNYTNVYQKLRDLLYTSTGNETEIQCFDRTCPSNSFCQVTLNTRMSPQLNDSEIYPNISCRTLFSNDSFLEVFETYLVPRHRFSTMVMRCNTNQCGNNKTVLDVYNIFRNEFIIPMNYSILYMDNVVSISIRSNPSIFIYILLFLSIKLSF